MYYPIKSVVVNYKGWFVALLLGIALPVVMNYNSVRQIDTRYLQGLINRQEVAHITIVKNRLAIKERYTAEITLTPTALKRFGQQGFTFKSSRMGHHFIAFAGSSPNEVNQWEQHLKSINDDSFSVRKSY